jgi:hypothetical protein
MSRIIVQALPSSRNPSGDIRALEVRRLDDPCPVERKREACRLEERTVLRVWHPEEQRALGIEPRAGRRCTYCT